MTPPETAQSICTCGAGPACDGECAGAAMQREECARRGHLTPESLQDPADESILRLRGDTFCHRCGSPGEAACEDLQILADYHTLVDETARASGDVMTITAMQANWILSVFPHVALELGDTHGRILAGEHSIDSTAEEEPGAELAPTFERAPTRPVAQLDHPVKRYCRACKTIWIDNPFTADYNWRPPNLAQVRRSEVPAGTPTADESANVSQQLADADRGVLIVRQLTERDVEILCRHEPALVEDHDVKWRPSYLEELKEDLDGAGATSVRRVGPRDRDQIDDGSVDLYLEEG